jgi:hypothetical protein
MAANLRTMLPMLERHKVTTAAEVDLATLAERLRRDRRGPALPSVPTRHGRACTPEQVTFGVPGLTLPLSLRLSAAGANRGSYTASGSM